jgi:hypothetical protein
MVLVLRNEEDDDDASTGNRTGMVSSTAISGILQLDLAFTIWVWRVGDGSSLGLDHETKVCCYLFLSSLHFHLRL